MAPVIKSWRIRLLLSQLAGIAIAAISYISAWLSHGDFMNFMPERWTVAAELDGMAKEIEAHRQQAGRYPESLDEVPALQRNGPRAAGGRNRQDPWGNPYQYALREGGFRLWSWGRDGRSGGEGLDADLYIGDFKSGWPPPTLWQFTVDLKTDKMLLLCLLAGAFGAGLCWLSSGTRDPMGIRMVDLLFRIAAVMVLSVIAATFLAVLHVPTGH